MFAVIRQNQDNTVTRLRTCSTVEAVMIASQLEKDKVSLAERHRIRAVAMDDGGYTEIMML